MSKWLRKARALGVRFGNYVLGRVTEISSLKGAVFLLGGLGWRDLDTRSRGELIAQGAMIVVGLLQILMPQERQYSTKPKAQALETPPP